jgi:hypothetical protein
MNHQEKWNFWVKFSPFRVLAAALGFVLLVGMACNTPATENTDSTQVSINVQATQIAKDQTLTAQSEEAEKQQKEIANQTATVNAKATQDAQAITQMALDVQATINAQPTNTPQPTYTPQPTHTPQPTAQQPQGGQQPPAGAQQPPAGAQQPPAGAQAPAGGQPAFDPAHFQAWMQSAKILLWEDASLVGVVQPALDAMSLNYVDVDDRIGDFKTQLLSGGPGGQGWDLIISAKEARENVSGEYYVYINDALNAGSSIIIEEWNIDDIEFGKIGFILGRCGVEVQKDWFQEPIEKQLLFPINGEHPVHHIPNEGISLTNPTGIWTFGDLGDFLELSPGSDAKLLWGARSAVKDSYATAVSCVDGRVIIQTYGSHSYGADRVVKMWVNYIYNTLLARYQYLAALGQLQP